MLVGKCESVSRKVRKSVKIVKIVDFGMVGENFDLKSFKKTRLPHANGISKPVGTRMKTSKWSESHML